VTPVSSQGPRNHRLHALCPYFAMFPPSFANQQILQHTKPGDLVLDPFSGRGTSLLEALLNDREAIASDINPVAYCVSAAKARRPSLGRILDEIDELERLYYRAAVGRLEIARVSLPAFFRRAFAAETLRQLIFLRSRLRWRSDPDHCFVTALLLGHLHGESARSDCYCSNQMPHTISTKPIYSLRYWQKHGLKPPDRDVFELLRDRAEYRLEEEGPERRGVVRLCDARRAAQHFRRFRDMVSVVITSPPYFDTTRFEEDQWLRLWLLGGAPKPTYYFVSKDDRHNSAEAYWGFLTEAWQGIAPLLRHSAVLVCRLGARGLDPDTLRDALTQSLRMVWRRVDLLAEPAITVLRNRQTAVLHPKSVGCRYEIDLTFRLAGPEGTTARTLPGCTVRDRPLSWPARFPSAQGSGRADQSRCGSRRIGVLSMRRFLRGGLTRNRRRRLLDA